MIRHTYIKLLALLLIVVASVCESQAQFSAVRVNALLLPTATLNGGYEYGFGKKTSFDIAIVLNPLSSKTFSTQLFAVQPGFRFWLRELSYAHFFGVHATGGLYNIGNKDFHYTGYAAGIGASWGYSWPLKKRLNLAFEIGASIMYLNDKRELHNPPTSTDYHIYNFQRLAIVPTKCELSLVWLF